MAALRLKAVVTADRQLKLDLPEDLPVGAEVEITLERSPAWTDEEIAALMAELETIQPQSGAEIVAWLQSLEGGTGWEHIEDGGEWVEKQRRKSRERSQW